MRTNSSDEYFIVRARKIIETTPKNELNKKIEELQSSSSKADDDLAEKIILLKGRIQ